MLQLSSISFVYYKGQQAARGGNSAAHPDSIGVMPWLGRNVAHIAQTPLHRSYPESIVDFYSPLESPIHSDGEHESSETESMEKKKLLLGRGNNHVPSSTEVSFILEI